jgi:DNA-binding NarL/FixJ family response regulator
MTRVLVVDDHALVRRGVILLLAGERDFGEFGEAGSAAELFALLSRDARWDVLLLDIGLPDRSGIEILPELRTAYPTLPILMLTMHTENGLAMLALREGARGYVTKDSLPEDLVSAIHRALGGRRYVSPSLAERLALGPRGAAHEALSAREHQVFTRLAGGAPLKKIAQDLGVSPKTVTTYRTRVLEKLGMRTNAELVRYALRAGIVPEAHLAPRRRESDKV